MTALLSARGLRVARASREVLHGIDLELRPGEVAALLGPNGAGKSTLVEAFAGLAAVSGGSVTRSGRVALAMQSPDLARRTVEANIRLALSWWGVPRDERSGRALAALEAMQAGHLAGREAAALSGGERRRVHLARAVAVKPDVLLLDEPFAGLDAATRATLLDDTGAALRKWASTALVVVHDRAEAWALADRLLVMIDGRLVADGPPRDLFSSPPSVEIARFLGFDGTLVQPDGSLLLTRAQHVVIDSEASLRARVVRAIPVEDGLRVELELERGRVFAFAPLPGVAAGELVGVRVTGGARFSASAAPTAQEALVPGDRAQSVMP